MPLVSNRTQGWADLLLPYDVSASVFQCPSAGQSSEAFSTDYFFNTRVAGLSKSQVAFPARTIGFGDGADNAPTNSHLTQLPANWKTDDHSPAQRHIGSGNYLFFDGHVASRGSESVLAKPPSRRGDWQATFAPK